MKRVELLAPAGDFDSLVAAVQSGANAIYLGGTLFSARVFAKNFSREELKQAIEYAHLRNVKVYVTVNTLFKDDEFKELIDYLDYLYFLQVDALLIQDIGLIKVVLERYPDFEIHISTQMSLHNLEGIRYFERLGVKRIVLARENTIEEIRYICSHTSLEVEVFAHGAMCVAYSGQCLMSSFIGKRSGNRGACAQPCRLPYTLMQDNKILNHEAKYLLSPKDLCTAQNINRLIEAGVHSLKLEGRMKKPEYVAAITTTYSKAIRHYYDQNSESYSDQDFNNMKQMFNREYTNGYIFNDNEIVKDDYSGNKGIVVGSVTYYNKSTKRVTIKLTDSIMQGDSIVFENIDKGRPVNKIYLNNKLINKAKKGDSVEIEFDYFVKEGYVRRTVSKEVIDDLNKAMNMNHKSRILSMHFIARRNQPMHLTLTSDGESVSVESIDSIEVAKNTPTDSNRVLKQLIKLGNTIYNSGDVHIDMDEDVNIPIALLNQLRREGIDKLDAIFIRKKKYNGELNDIANLSKKCKERRKLYIVTYTLEQLKIALEMDTNAYMVYNKDTWSEAKQVFDLYHSSPKVFLSRVEKDQDLYNINGLDHVQDMIVNDYGSYEYFKDRKNIIHGTGFNVFNSYAASNFTKPVVASYECSKNQIMKMSIYNEEMIYPVYGKIENMISEHCVISQYFFQKKIKNCRKCKEHSYSLVDRKGEVFDVLTDEHCRNHIFNAKTLYIDHLQNIPTSFLLTFTTENSQTTQSVIEDYMNIIRNDTKSKIKENFDYTIGYFKQ